MGIIYVGLVSVLLEKENKKGKPYCHIVAHGAAQALAQILSSCLPLGLRARGVVPGTDETVLSSLEGREDGFFSHTLICAFLSCSSCFHLLFTHALVSSLTVGYSLVAV